MSASVAPRPAGDQYVVVVNHEEQYSVWFADRELPMRLDRHRRAGHPPGVPGPHRAGVDRPDPELRTSLTMTAGAVATAWLRGLGSRELTAQRRLFVFPHAAAGASAYRLAAYLPDAVEVCTVQLPGRENRLAEPALTSLDDAVAALAPLIADHTDLPYAFFGHSMGSLIAFETAHAATCTRHAPARPPVPVGYARPGLPDRDLRHTLPDDKLLATAEFGDVDAELQELLLPLLRADLTLCETYTHRAEAPLPCPLTVLVSSDDESVDGTELMRLARAHLGRLRTAPVPGRPHLYVRGAERQLAETITRTFPERG